MRFVKSWINVTKKASWKKSDEDHRRLAVTLIAVGVCAIDLGVTALASYAY